MLAAVAAQIAGNVAGRAEILAEADRHVVVDPTFDFLCPGPWIALTPYRNAALALHFRVVAVDEMTTLEIHVFRFAWPGQFGRTTAGAHMKFKCVACDVRRRLPFVAYEGRGSVVVSLYGNPVNRRARFVWTGDSLIQRDAGAYQNVSCPGACVGGCFALAAALKDQLAQDRHLRLGANHAPIFIQPVDQRGSLE